MNGMLRATVQIDVLLNSRSFSLSLLATQTTSLINRAEKELSSVGQAEIHVDVDRVNEHSRDKSWANDNVPGFCQVFVRASKRNPP